MASPRIICGARGIGVEVNSAIQRVIGLLISGHLIDVGLVLLPFLSSSGLPFGRACYSLGFRSGLCLMFRIYVGKHVLLLILLLFPRLTVRCIVLPLREARIVSGSLFLLLLRSHAVPVSRRRGSNLVQIQRMFLRTA
jgi:hypothetical protein